jgi:drug/metabolite transporter (DMT)-like permease
MFAALLSSIANASGLILDKIILSRKKLGLHVFLPLSFLLLFLFSLILVPNFGRIDWDIAGLTNELFLLFMMVIVAIAWNVLYYQSVQREKVHHTELIMMFAPLVTIILAAVFFPENLDKRIFVLAIIASLALIFSKSTKEHFFTGRTSYNTFLAVILMSTEAIIIRELLFSYTPVALYAVRTFFIALFFFFYYRPKKLEIQKAYWGMLVGSSLLGLVTMLGKFYAFSQLGIVYTTMILILGPILVFLASWEILHERIRPRMIIASLVVLACVALATVLMFG